MSTIVPVPSRLVLAVDTAATAARGTMANDGVGDAATGYP